MSERLCESCKHWDRVDFRPLTNHYYRDCRVLTDRAPDQPVIARGVTSESGVMTRSDFGCVRHEAR